MENYKQITRDDFMCFFRDDEKLNESTVETELKYLASGPIRKF